MNWNKSNHYYIQEFPVIKIKNNWIDDYIDKHLKERIFVFDNNMFDKSSFREKHLIPSSFSTKIKNVFLLRLIFNKWNLYHFYPHEDHKQAFKNARKEQFLYSSFYQRMFFVINCKYNSKFVKKAYKKKFKPFFASQQKKFKSNILNLKFFKRRLVNKRKRWVWKTNKIQYVDFRGNLFELNIDFSRRCSSLRMFRGHWFFKFKKCIVALNTFNAYFLSKGIEEITSLSKEVIYRLLVGFLFNEIKQKLWRLRRVKPTTVFGKLWRGIVKGIRSLMKYHRFRSLLKGGNKLNKRRLQGRRRIVAMRTQSVFSALNKSTIILRHYYERRELNFSNNFFSNLIYNNAYSKAKIHIRLMGCRKSIFSSENGFLPYDNT